MPIGASGVHVCSADGQVPEIKPLIANLFTTTIVTTTTILTGVSGVAILTVDWVLFS